jgi:hypothetical protein
MKKIIRDVDSDRGILQVTCSDERWYLKRSEDAAGLPSYKSVPSVTWIAGYYPKGVEFYKWLADKGWDEAEAVKTAAGDKGSAVHHAIEMILKGEEFRIDTKVIDKNRSTEVETIYRDLSFEELLCVKSFLDWFNEVKPEVIATERTIFSDIHNFAGTVDFVCRIDGVPYIIDFKTSKSIWREYELQVSAYRMAMENGENPIFGLNENGTDTGKQIDLSGLRTAILQVGYTRNKAGWKFTEIEDAFPLFKVAQQIWQREAGSQEIKQYQFPIVLSAGRKSEPQIVREEEVTVEEAIPEPLYEEAMPEPLYEEATPEPLDEPVRKSKKK